MNTIKKRMERDVQRKRKGTEIKVMYRKCLNRTRKKNEKIECNVGINTWKNLFVTLLEGTEKRKLGD